MEVCDGKRRLWICIHPLGQGIVHYPGRIGNFGVPSDCEMAFNDALTMIQRLYCRVTSDETPGGRMQLFVSPFRKGDRPLRASDQAA